MFVISATKIYQVRVTSYIPYPITREYTEKATAFATAVARAMKEYRRDPRVLRKRIDKMSVVATNGTLLA